MFQMVPDSVYGFDLRAMNFMEQFTVSFKAQSFDLIGPTYGEQA